MLVADLLRVGGAFDEAGDAVHGAGPVEGDDGGDVLNALGLEPDADAGHASAFQLEHAAGAAGGEHLKGLLIVLRHGLNAKARGMAADQLHRVVQHCQVPQAQKVHLQQAQLLQGGHLVLADHGLVIGGQGHIFVHRPLRDHHAGGVGGGVAGHALQSLCHIDQPVQLLVPVVHLLQGLGQAQGLVQGHVQRTGAGGDLLCHLVGLAVADIQGPGHIPDRGPGGHGAEGDDLGHMVVAVEPVHIVNDLAPAVDAEVHVNIRHGDPLRVQEAFKEQAVFDGVHIGDMQAVADHAAGGAAPAGANGDAAALGEADEVRNNEKVVHKAHFVDHIQLIIQLLVHLRPVGEALLKALLAELAEIGIAVALPLRQLEAGQMVVAELKIKIAALGNVHGVVRRFRQLREQGAHLLLALEVQLLALKAHPGRVVHGLAHLDAHQHILVIGVLFFDIVGVVGEGQGDASLPVKPD